FSSGRFCVQCNSIMYLRCNRRIKDGKEHRYWNIVESKRCAGGKGVQRQVLYLGEINDSQREAWCRVIEAFDEQSQQLTQLALFPAEGGVPNMLRLTGYRYGWRRWNYTGRDNGAPVGWPAISMRSFYWISSGPLACPILARAVVGAIFYRRLSVIG